MDLSFWSSQILIFVNEISDAEFQDSVWLRHNLSVQSSFTEVVCGLYDDFNFEQYIEELKYSGVNQSLLTPIEEFKTSMDRFLETKDSTDICDKAILSDPQWHKVRESAVKASISISSIAAIGN